MHISLEEGNKLIARMGSRVTVGARVGDCLADIERKRQPAEPVAVRKDRYRSGVERRYAELLEIRRLAGDIAAWQHEPLSMVVADDGLNRVRYTPDFLIWENDGSFWFCELKGKNPRLRNAGRSKAIMARVAYPLWKFRVFRFCCGSFEEILFEVLPESSLVAMQISGASGYRFFCLGSG